MKFISSVCAALMIAVSSAALAQQAQPKPGAFIKWRQSAFQVLAWNSSRIKANVESTQYNKEEVIKAANSTAAIANSGLGALFPPGTERGAGFHETATKPEFFTDGKKVAELAGTFTKEANELARIAADGDQAAVKAQFGKLTQTCRACHDDYKAKD